MKWVVKYGFLAVILWNSYNWPGGVVGSFELQRRFTSSIWLNINANIDGKTTTYTDATGTNRSCYRLRAKAPGAITSVYATMTCP